MVSWGYHDGFGGMATATAEDMATTGLALANTAPQALSATCFTVHGRRIHFDVSQTKHGEPTRGHLMFCVLYSSRLDWSRRGY